MTRYKFYCLLILTAVLLPANLLAQAGVLKEHLGYSGSSGLGGASQTTNGYFEMRCYQVGRLVFTERFTGVPAERAVNGFLAYEGTTDAGKKLQIVLSKETSCVIEQY